MMAYLTPFVYRAIRPAPGVLSWAWAWALAIAVALWMRR